MSFKKIELANTGLSNVYVMGIGLGNAFKRGLVLLLSLGALVSLEGLEGFVVLVTLVKFEAGLTGG